MRACEMCGTSIEHRGSNAKYCISCAKEIQKGQIKEHKIANANKSEKFCLDCGVNISDRYKSCKRCVSCQKKHNNKTKVIEDRYCKVCGTSIDELHPLSVYCGACKVKVRKKQRQTDLENRKTIRKMERVQRICIDCGTNISDRPANSKRCKECQGTAEIERSRRAGTAYRSNKKAKKKSTLSAMDKSNFARKYHSSYGRIENDIQTGRVKLEAEDVELAKELGLM